MTFRTCTVWGLAGLACVIWAGAAAQEPAPVAKRTADPSHAKHETAIRALVDRFVKAYNEHNAKSLAELFLPEAQIVDENDATISGRAAIERQFAGVFEETPEGKIAIEIEAIRFLGTALAIETGTTTTTAPGEPPERRRYSVLHVLHDGSWSMGLVRDMPALLTSHDQLQPLAWLVCDWIDESREGSVKTSCRWSDNGNFLLQEITVRQAGRDAMHISQRIGWDPLGHQIQAWVFDSDGGYGSSVWTPTDAGWIIKATSVHSDGSTASATNSLELTGPDRYVFRSVDRVAGHQVLPPVEVAVVRQPPPPK